MDITLLFPAVLLQATKTTILLAITSLLLGLPLALCAAASRSWRWQLLAKGLNSALLLIRGLPEMLVLLLVYIGANQIPSMVVESPISLSDFWSGTIALALIFAAYAAETLRGALQAVPAAQREAALALGLREWVIFYRILMPQAWRLALPGLGNQWLVLLKDTALVSLIGVNDLMQQSKLMAINSQKPFTNYLVAGAIYLGITLVSQLVLRHLTGRAQHCEKDSV